MSKLGEWFRRGEAITITPEEQKNKARVKSGDELRQDVYRRIDEIHVQEEVLKKIFELSTNQNNRKK